ncbi:hypothetical protein [Mycolicibacterium fortuitum]|jgi:hypothetical protein|uniref:Uncharacterized protein n=1 Tax=Mycolicibacterium fortuitum subsp. fortuitum DSM 46621 = ATCC 6841 = JCM 6387 TaxID=1214102 RepID=K0UYT2_MYCFO|nr:hypothetical protein [Mycolicibacterium fortuitum]AIY46822.1 hypothetical protein G155_16060 [Mycobacterium sp. VKM Ac-1817D]AMD54995.1 hypothetical protein ATO49_15405 [Mycolicibacterium fortuitum subsp. fortuitum DSM 46621 = ATCC 6841 = JCM 6387]EJZ12302.1 hypothetical protein MFORT_17673 [Mycolicibacterium fortuitum subsp. fortuitum DSM 46621 = ATCC 6841 = JCM 6387]MBP3083935.1 hypothetical protein [Mycolicibacterium fortuitum]MCA4725921.1 hypothetical protein [Mycolicibacterium fortuitu
MTTTDERHEIGQLAESGGWLHRDLDRVDVYQRGPNRIRVVWQGQTALSGATLYQDDIMTTYTRELSTLSSWLKR